MVSIVNWVDISITWQDLVIKSSYNYYILFTMIIAYKMCL